MTFGFGLGLAIRTGRRLANMSDAHRDKGSVVEGVALTLVAKMSFAGEKYGG
jgi:hypothetical protein